MRDAEKEAESPQLAFESAAKEFLERIAPGGDVALRGKTASLIGLVAHRYSAGETEMIEKLTAVASGTMIAAKKVGGVLPDLPPGYTWPTEKFRDSPEFNSPHAIVSFLERVWLPIIQLRLIHRGHLAIKDPDAGKALENYFYNKGRTRRCLPEHIAIPPQRLRQKPQYVERQMKNG